MDSRQACHLSYISGPSFAYINHLIAPINRLNIERANKIKVHFWFTLRHNAAAAPWTLWPLGWHRRREASGDTWYELTQIFELCQLMSWPVRKSWWVCVSPAREAGHSYCLWSLSWLAKPWFSNGYKVRQCLARFFFAYILVKLSFLLIAQGFLI